MLCVIYYRVGLLLLLLLLLLLYIVRVYDVSSTLIPYNKPLLCISKFQKPNWSREMSNINTTIHNACVAQKWKDM